MTPPAVRLTSPRHVLASLALALLLGAAGTTVVGVAAAQDGTGEPMVRDFHIPLPAAGDRAVYDVVRSPAMASYNITGFELEWMADHRHLRPDGELVLTNRLRHADLLGPSSFGDHVYEGRASTSGPIMEAGRGKAFASELIFLEDQPDNHRDLRYIGSDWSTVPCVARNVFQGRSWTFEGAPVVETTGCHLSGHSGGSTVVWNATKHAGIDGTRWVVVEAREHGYFYNAQTTWVLQEGVAYPVRVLHQNAYDSHGRGQSHSGSQEMTLRSLVTGDPPIATQPQGFGRLPVLQTAPRGFLGPDASGVELPFPLAEAIQAITADERNGTAVRDWLSAHPEAYVGAAERREIRNDRGQTTIEWALVLSDGRASLGRHVSFTTGPIVVTNLPNLPSFVLPVDDSARISIEERGVEDRYPLPAQLPPGLPTVASQAAAYEFLRAAEGSGLAFNHWAFDLSCFDEACTATRSSLTAGHAAVQVDYNDGPTDQGEDSIAYDRLVLRFNGTQLDGSSTVHWDSAEGTARATPTPATRFQQAPDEGYWKPLTFGQAASVGLVATLLAALYWLWPALKGGGVSLFSRIEDDDLAGHPVRAQLLQAIAGQPGLHYQELRRRLQLSNGVLDHHLRKLVVGGRIRSRAAGGYTSYFLAGTDRRLVQAAGALNSDGARRVFAAVVARPGIRTPDLAAASGIAHSTLVHHVNRLLTAGLIVATRAGRAKSYVPTVVGLTVAGAGAAANSPPSMA